MDTSAGLIGLVLAFGVATLGRIEHQAHALAGHVGTLPAKDRMMRQLVDNSFDAIVTFGADGQVLSYNRAAERIFGVAAHDVIGRPIRRLLPDHRHGSFKTLAQTGGIHELEAEHGAGRRFPVEATFGRMEVDEKWVGIAILRDVTERKLQEAELERMALHDALTGLPNRTLLSNRIEHAIRSAQRTGDHMAILLLDLDRFKDVNDTLGHQVGDQLLTEVGPRLERPLRAADTVARLGGDEFAILLVGPTDLEMACRVAERVVEALRHPFAIQDLALEVGISIGVALYPEHGTTASELLQHADVAMYAAKRDQLGFVVYSAESDTHSVRQLTLTGELRRAIEDDQLVLEFQPKIDARTAELAGVEALIRWEHPEHGSIRPDEFIHSAEQTGLIKPLTLWVLNAALRALQDWQQDGYDFGVAVNLSVKSLHDPQLPDVVRLLLQSWQQQPALLTFEITERADGRPGDRPDGARAHLGDRVPPVARRLRHRLFVACVPAEAAHRRAQDRSFVRGCHDPRPQRRGDRPLRRPAGQGPGPRRGCRGRGERGGVRPTALARLRARARLLLWLLDARARLSSLAYHLTLDARGTASASARPSELMGEAASRPPAASSPSAARLACVAASRGKALARAARLATPST